VDVILLMGIEACRYKNEVGLEAHQVWNNVLSEYFPPPLASGGARLDREIKDACRAVFVLFVYIFFCHSTCVRVEIVTVEMHALELYIFTVLIVKPRLEHRASARIVVVEDTHSRWFSELNLLLHTFDDLLGTIAMVYIKIDYRHALNFLAVDVAQICRSNGDIVNIAEAVGLLLIAFIFLEGLSKYAGMMTWGTNCAKSILIIITHHLVHRFDYRAR